MSLVTNAAIRMFAAQTAFGLLAVLPAAAQFPAENVSLYSQVTLQDFGANSARDCWGYVSPSGREYAIIGLTNGAGFVEITDPANPVILAVMPQAVALDIKVYQNYVYSASGNVRRDEHLRCFGHRQRRHYARPNLDVVRAQSRSR